MSSQSRSQHKEGQASRRRGGRGGQGGRSGRGGRGDHGVGGGRSSSPGREDRDLPSAEVPDKEAEKVYQDELIDSLVNRKASISQIHTFFKLGFKQDQFRQRIFERARAYGDHGLIRNGLHLAMLAGYLAGGKKPFQSVPPQLRPFLDRQLSSTSASSSEAEHVLLPSGPDIALALDALADEAVKMPDDQREATFERSLSPPRRRRGSSIPPNRSRSADPVRPSAAASSRNRVRPSAAASSLNRVMTETGADMMDYADHLIKLIADRRASDQQKQEFFARGEQDESFRVRIFNMGVQYVGRETIVKYWLLYMLMTHFDPEVRQFSAVPPSVRRYLHLGLFDQENVPTGIDLAQAKFPPLRVLRAYEVTADAAAQLPLETQSEIVQEFLGLGQSEAPAGATVQRSQPARTGGGYGSSDSASSSQPRQTPGAEGAGRATGGIGGDTRGSRQGGQRGASTGRSKGRGGRGGRGR